MRSFLLGTLFVLGSAPLLAAQQRARGDEIAPGWRGDPRVWRVEGDQLVGSSVGVPLRHNTFLIRDGELADFELTCEVLLEGDNNGGVQYRSRVVDEAKYRVHGYQCDVHPNPPYLAMLYDEGGGGIVAQRGQLVRWTDAGREQLGRIAQAAPADVSQWRRLRIVARGDVCWHELDGEVCTAFQDLREAAPRRGVVALQLHQGRPMTARYRNVEVRELAADGDVAAPPLVRALLQRAALRAAAAAAPVPAWLWDDEAGDDEELFLRREFELPAAPERARLGVSCDNNCRVYVNGVLVARDDSWESPTFADVKQELRPGRNVVAVHAWNDGGPAGMALRLTWRAGAASGELVSDAAWRCHPEDPDGWDRPGFDDAGWRPATVQAAMGAEGAPWSGQLGRDGLGTTVDPYAPQVAFPADDLERLGGEGPAGAIELLQVPRELGSWVSLCADDRGRLYSCDQGGRGIFRITPATEVAGVTRFEHMPVDLSSAHGLLWFRDALYAVVNGKGSGLYRVTDRDGDGLLEHKELLRALDGSGEHGPHSVEVAPDGEHLLVLCGNMTKLTELSASRVPTHWAEDRLVPRIDDARGFWGGYSPPGGCLYQIDPDGREWELICCGFRNPFDFAVLPNGQVVVYDADMEWDMGTPWYRPTRYCVAQSGVDYGWRKGSMKWPADYPDAPPPLQVIGPGSPTGMVSVPGERGGMIALDWTFGTIYFEGEPWIAGVPLPIADVTWTARDADAIYVVTGGRGLPSRLLRVPLDSAPHRPEAERLARWGSPLPWPEEETRSAEQILAAVPEGEPQAAVAARIALERLPAARVRAAALQVDPQRPDRSFAGLLALARIGEPADLGPMLAALGGFDWGRLDHGRRVAWLRAHALALLRLGPADDAARRLVADRLLPLFPSGDERQDQDLCELLAYVKADGLLERAVPLLRELRPSPPPPWTELAARNQSYGGVIAKMIENMPPMGQLAIADALRTVETGWTPDQRRTYFAFLAAARERSGGASYDGFVVRIVDAAWQTCGEDERPALEFAVGRARAAKQKFRSKPPKGPGNDWQLEDIAALCEPGFDGRDRKAGRNLFWATGCASCHYFRGEGGFGGPDLTSLKNKMRPEDVLESILEPSRVISDQYSGQILTRKDGTALFGVVHRTYFGDVEVYEVVEAKPDAEPVRIPVDEVRSVAPSPMSPMPKDLLDRLSADEVRDLIAFLLQGDG